MRIVPDLLALLTIVIWPVVPLFWIPVHCFPMVFRKLGFYTYIMPVMLWLPPAYFIFTNRDFLLQFKLYPPFAVNEAGLMLSIAGGALQIWTGELQGLRGLIGLPEITKKVEGRLVVEGAFSIVRHPTYLSHTLMFAGVFLLTGVIAVGIVTLLDFIIINAVVIPLEERELISRFGEAYEAYKARVPRFFPVRISRP